MALFGGTRVSTASRLHLGCISATLRARLRRTWASTRPRPRTWPLSWSPSPLGRRSCSSPMRSCCSTRVAPATHAVRPRHTHATRPRHAPQVLASDAYTLRCGAVSAFGQLQIAVAAMPTPLPPEVADAASGLIASVVERLHDTSSFVRARALATLSHLCESRALPTDRFGPVARLGLARLADKNANVRRAALQLYARLLEFNPFCATLRREALVERREALCAQMPAGWRMPSDEPCAAPPPPPARHRPPAAAQPPARREVAVEPSDAAQHHATGPPSPPSRPPRRARRCPTRQRRRARRRRARRRRRRRRRARRRRRRRLPRTPSPPRTSLPSRCRPRLPSGRWRSCCSTRRAGEREDGRGQPLGRADAATDRRPCARPLRRRSACTSSSPRGWAT